MYTKRLKSLKKAMNVLEKNNQLYIKYTHDKNQLSRKCEFAYNMRGALQTLAIVIAEGEKQWRDGILKKIEDEIAQALAFIYPEDGYRVTLTSRILRGKLHIDSYVSSMSLSKVTGRMKRTQGMLFRQIVSMSAIICIMELQGIKTVYIDEAFSGASKKNMLRARKLVQWYAERGINLIVIAQDPAVSADLNSNTLYIRREYPNVTVIEQDNRVNMPVIDEGD